MPSTIDIRRRIRSVKNTQQITKAMKMVAAAKLRRAQERMFAARPYAAALRQVLTSVATRVEELEHPLLRSHEQENNVLLVVVTADKGLAGAFNSNVIRAAANALRDHKWQSVQIVPIGRKAMDFFKRRMLWRCADTRRSCSAGTRRQSKAGMDLIPHPKNARSAAASSAPSSPLGNRWP